MLSKMKHLHMHISDSSKGPIDFGPPWGTHMKIEEAQEMMRKVYWERDRRRGVEGTLQRTKEELAELSHAILEMEGNEAIEGELADVFAWLCSLANLLDIDMSEAFYMKYPDACSKCKHAPCKCPDE